ncbi:hypothetical protein MTO96_011930 [Rhipicephalus appendiculatus]
MKNERLHTNEAAEKDSATTAAICRRMARRYTIRRRSSHGQVSGCARQVTTRGPSAYGQRDEEASGEDRAARPHWRRPADAMTPLARSTGCQSPMAPVNAVRQGRAKVIRRGSPAPAPRTPPVRTGRSLCKKNGRAGTLSGSINQGRR